MNMQLDYSRVTWYIAPYLGVLIASVWLFRHAQKWPAWLMLIGAALRFCDIFALNVVRNLWPSPSMIVSPEDYRVVQLHRRVEGFFETFGSLGMLMFAVGFLLFAWHLRTSQVTQLNKSLEPTADGTGSSATRSKP